MLDSSAIDQIVHNVLRQLRSSGGGTATLTASQTPASIKVETQRPTPLPASTAVPATPILLTERVVTADLLAEKLGSGRRVALAPKAILTPSAQDYIKEHKVEVIRIAAGSGVSAVSAGPAKFKLLIVRSTPAIEKLRAELKWPTELLGCPDEAAKLAISAITRGESEGVVIIAQQQHRAACQANRHEKVKAVAIREPAEVKAVREQLRANVWCCDPTKLSYFELQLLLRHVAEPK